MEGPLSLVECIKDSKICEKTDICITRDLWNGLSEKIDDFLEAVTLQQLVEKHRSKQKSRPLMYSI